MRAIRMHTTGGPEVLTLETVPDPVPGPGQVLVRVEAVGVNFIEIYQRSGLYPIALPSIPGSEGAGTVVALGEGVTGITPGARVASVAFTGAYAELALAPADALVPLPDAVSTRQAAALMLQGMTAHYLACATRPLAPGDTCLVLAAAGGVGLLLIQIARRRGARVIACASSDDKRARALAAGADFAIGYDAIADEVRRLTAGAGVALVYDSVGRTTFEASLASLARRGTLVLFGQASGPVPPFDPQELNRRGSLFLTRPKLGDYTATRAELLERAGDVLGWVADESLRLTIDRELPLSAAAQAHTLLASRATSGKLVLVPSLEG